MSTISRDKMTQTDSKGKVVRAPRQSSDSMDPAQFLWWQSSEETMAQDIVSTIKFIQTHDTGRIDRLTAATRLYGTAESLSSLGKVSQRRTSNTSSPTATRVSYNVIRSLVDTLQAKMAKNKITPTFCTNGGVWGMQKKSRDLTKFIEGCFYQNDIHSVGMDVARDAFVWGTGALGVYQDGDKICAERCMIDQFWVDSVEAHYGYPTQLHRVRPVDRQKLKQMFKDDEEAVKLIDDAMPASSQELGIGASASDLVIVYESWHLPSAEDAGDGVHTICVDSGLLCKNEWEKDFYPFAFLRYQKQQLGFWGVGVPERQQDKQYQINELMYLDARSRRMMASFKVLLKYGSKVVSQHMNNDVGSIIWWTGDVPPQYVTPPPIDPSNEVKIDSLISKAYQEEGISQLTASSLKPMGLDSGKALRTYNDIENDRQLFLGQEIEKFFLEVAMLMIETAKDIYKDSRTYQVTFPSGRFMETIDWKDIKLGEDEYVLKAFPVSSLADDMSGRLQEVQELAQAGMISPRTARKLMRTPDLEMSDNLANAAEDNLSKIIEEMIDNEEYSAPEPFYDLTLAKQLVLEYYNYCKFQNAPEEVLDLLRQFSAQIDDLTGAALPPQPMMAAPGGAPPANPELTPKSPLIPNVNNGVAA